MGSRLRIDRGGTVWEFCARFGDCDAKEGVEFVAKGRRALIWVLAGLGEIVANLR